MLRRDARVTAKLLDKRQALPAWSQSSPHGRSAASRPCSIPRAPRNPGGDRSSARQPCLEPLRTQLCDRLVEPACCSLRERIGALEEVSVRQLDRRQRGGDLALEIEWLVAAHRETEGPE